MSDTPWPPLQRSRLVLQQVGTDPHTGEPTYLPVIEEQERTRRRHVLMETRGYGQCPSCWFECWQDVCGPRSEEPYLVEIKNQRRTDTDYGAGEDWTEVWQCPYCGTAFEEEDGYP